MHYSGILAICDFPTVTRDEKWEKESEKKIKEYVGVCESLQLVFALLTDLNVKKTSFGKALYPVITDIMDRFLFSPDKKENLDFIVCSEEEMVDLDQSLDMVRYPNGSFVADSWFFDGKKEFRVVNGVIYQVVKHPVEMLKRTKHAKKYRFFPKYPVRKAFHSTDDLIRGLDLSYVFNPEIGKYGEWYNPDGICDSYSIGGRWANAFLVKDTCEEYTDGVYIRSANEVRPAPDGYKWVSSARKKDIEWDEMRKLESCPATMYPILVSALMTAEELYCKEQIKEPDSWEEQITTFLNELSEDTVLVSLDLRE